MNQDLRRKLQIGAEQSILFINAGDMASRLVDKHVSFYSKENPPETSFDVVIVFAQTITDIRLHADKVLKLMRKGGSLWYGYPKRSSKIATDLGRDNGWEPMMAKGFLPVRQIAFDENWSLLRFKPKEDIAQVKRGIDYPGIDSKAKTVIIPDDLMEALRAHGCLEEFESRSFTQRKEAVVSVITAKQEITRKKRIEKIVRSFPS